MVKSWRWKTSERKIGEFRLRCKREKEGMQSAYYALNASGDALSSAHGPQIANWRSASWGRRKGSAVLSGRAPAPPRATLRWSCKSWILKMRPVILTLDAMQCHNHWPPFQAWSLISCVVYTFHSSFSVAQLAALEVGIRSKPLFPVQACVRCEIR